MMGETAADMIAADRKLVAAARRSPSLLRLYKSSPAIV